MKDEDYESRDSSRGIASDLGTGVRSYLPTPLHSSSPYLSPCQVQFRMPDYGKEQCPTPHIEQIEFLRFSGPCNEETSDQQVAGLQIRPTRSTLSLDAIYDNEGIAPGILRPDEHHNRLGRCDHHENRYHDSASAPFVDRSRNNSNTTDDHTTLVGSPLSQTYVDKICRHFSDHRCSSSSLYSSCSSNASDKDAVLSTRQLIRYYTSFENVPDDEILTSRASRSLNMHNPWTAEGVYGNSGRPLQTYSIERFGPRSLPTPYQKPNQRQSTSPTRNTMPCAKSESKHPKIPRRYRLSSDWIEKNAYILRLCEAFLLYGVQAHRLEDYLHNTAAFLGTAAEFQHIPHCMLVVLTNPASEANDIHLLKESTSVDLGKLEDVYHIYEAVIEHDQDLRLSIRQLDSIVRRRRIHSNFLLVPLHGLAALCAGTFAFSARPIDFGPLFVFGCLLAILQMVFSRTPIRNSHILEVLTCVIVAFASRGLGSINLEGGSPLFCFSGITQGTVALILPGHAILAATHEIQHRQVLSGSIKMVCAILYTLFLGFGILVGAAIFGFIDTDATDSTTCELPWYWDTLATRWRATYAQFVWVPIFALAISIMHQAKIKHLPAMVFIATCGHQAFYWSLFRFGQNLQFAGMIAAFTSGLLANIYARISSCLAATTLLPAVLIHIPNALAASGSLVAGVETADAIVTNQSYSISHSIAGLYERDFIVNGPSGSTGLIVTAGLGMAQATIGITIGLFLSAFVVWPFLRRRTGFLSF